VVLLLITSLNFNNYLLLLKLNYAPIFYLFL
jgi:hypothetical protein